ncbi:hypothetical protein B0H10DRAFT_1942179 [Mycena sp. CBHHK59/15]|nr:hypothetical protein B0H10DRAFT_1942179 [Mycena sp. CBHHK59/15]
MHQYPSFFTCSREQLCGHRRRTCIPFREGMLDRSVGRQLLNAQETHCILKLNDAADASDVDDDEEDYEEPDEGASTKKRRPKAPRGAIKIQQAQEGCSGTRGSKNTAKKVLCTRCYLLTWFNSQGLDATHDFLMNLRAIKFLNPILYMQLLQTMTWTVFDDTAYWLLYSGSTWIPGGFLDEFNLTFHGTHEPRAVPTSVLSVSPPSTTSSAKSPFFTGAMIFGIAVGGSLVLGSSILLIIYLSSRRRSSDRESMGESIFSKRKNTGVTAFVSPSTKQVLTIPPSKADPPPLSTNRYESSKVKLSVPKPAVKRPHARVGRSQRESPLAELRPYRASHGSPAAANMSQSPRKAFLVVKNG